MTKERDDGVDLPADWEPKNGYVLSIGPGKDASEVLAIISDGTPQRGDENVTVLTLESFEFADDTNAKIRLWFERMLEERPWVTRN